MIIKSKDLPKALVEVSIELSVEDMKPYLEKAARKISENKSIPGFRPGKASVEAVKQHVGDMILWQEAGEIAVYAGIKEAVEKENLKTIGQPKVEVEKLAPGNPFVFTATFSKVPEVELPDYSKMRVKRKKTEITDEQVDESIEELRKMRRSEVLVDRKSEDGDKLEISLTVTVGGRKVDDMQKGGVVIGEGRFIPGFEDELIGLAKGDKKEFDLNFPKDYHESNLAGKKARFAIEVFDVYELSLPEVNDDFAENVAKVRTVDDLKKQIRQNLETEASRQGEIRLENEIIEKITNSSTFGEIPELLVTTETRKMLSDMEQQVSQQGMTLDQYLERIGKTQSEIMLDMTPQALNRVKAGLVLREIMNKRGINAKKEELDSQIEMLKNMYQHQPDMQKHFSTPQYREYLESTLLSRKVYEHLKEVMVDGEGDETSDDGNRAKDDSEDSKAKDEKTEKSKS